MTEEAPSWPETFGRMRTTGFRTATGGLRYRLSDDGNGELRFWHEVPDRWRVEDSRGVWHVADGRRQLVRGTDGLEDMTGAAMTFGQRHPQYLFGVPRDGVVEFGWLRDFPAPDDPGVPVEVAGRRAWEFALLAVPNKRARKPHPLRIAVDDVTGTVLRLAIPEAGRTVELTSLVLDGDLPADVFTWDGPVSTRHAEDRAERERVQRWLNETRLPVPHWWPRGLTYHGGDGDPDTGAYRVLLETPDFPELSRWPAGTPMPTSWADRHGGRHVHRWRDERWEWALAVDEPLTEEDLARVVESIPRD